MICLIIQGGRKTSTKTLLIPPLIDPIQLFIFKLFLINYNNIITLQQQPQAQLQVFLVISLPVDFSSIAQLWQRYTLPMPQLLYSFGFIQPDLSHDTW